MEKLYNRIDFHNDSVPALNESNLNAISKGLDDIDNRLIKVAKMVGNGSGSNVEWNQIQEDGKKIAEITINGESTDVFAPEGSGSITRYGTTEEFEEIKDDPEIAEGTEFLVTDDYVDPIEYSEEETCIGTYFGAPLYRRVVRLTSSTTGEHRLTYDLSFVRKMVKVDAMANGYIASGANMNSFSNWGFCFCDWNASGFNIFKGAKYGAFEVEFIIEYTKATD